MKNLRSILSQAGKAPGRMRQMNTITQATLVPVGNKMVSG